MILTKPTTLAARLDRVSVGRARLPRPRRHALRRSASRGRSAGTPKFPNFPAKAKHNIVLFMAGGPSQIDMFDPKPALLKYQGQRPASVDLRTERTTGGLLPSPFEFKQYGQGGVDVSSCCPTSHRRSTTFASSSRCTPSTRRTRRRAACSIRATSLRRGRRWARGSPTDWARRTRICRASSC